ncbi:SPOR domain-containing protein [Robiginitalea sp.]|uniref:SPOR domain-containing protein n=1 Tax=Robiginitalea sp. TaxID=1902411 RepID=UPI003C5E0B84
MRKLFFTLGFLLFLSFHLHGQQGQVSIDEDPQIKKLLAIYKDAKANALYYTIQIGFGSYDAAEELKQEASVSFPEYVPKIVFDSPTYRVHIGQFTDRLLAEKKVPGSTATIPRGPFAAS